MRRQGTKIITLIIFAALVSESSGPLYALEAKKTNSRGQSLKKPSKKSTEITLLPGDISEKSEKELIGLIKGFQAIIKTPGQGGKRNSYILSQMASYLALSRIYRVRKDATEKDKKNEALSLERVINFKEYFRKTKTATNEEKAKALFYGGQAYIYQNNYTMAIESFQESIRLDQKSPYVGTMSIFIAETWFDEEKYTEAIKQYNVHFNKLNELEKALAIYKIAWCLLNLNRYQEAEKNFTSLIGKSWAGHFSADSLKDLAYTGTLFRTEQEIIEQSYKLFKDSETQLEYLMQSFNFYLVQSSSMKRPLLFAELMRRVKDPVKKMNLLLIEFHGAQKQYASIEPFRVFLSIESFIKSEKINTESSAFITNKDQLETELQYLAKAYSDTFTGKTKTPEKLEVEELIRTLRYILNFHLIYFPKSKEREVSYKSLLTLCSKQKDFRCLYVLSNKILAEDFSKEFKEQIMQEKINAIESLLAKNPELRPEQISTIESYVNENPNAEKWLLLTKRLTVLLNEEKKFDRSIPWLEKIHKKENTSESLYRLQYALFENGDYKTVAGYTSEVPKDENGMKVQKLIGEAHIRLAESSIGKNDFDSYEKNISSFLASNVDEEKANAARLDYLERLLDRKENEKVYQEIKKMTFTQRFGKTFSTTTQRLISIFMKELLWSKVESLYIDRGASVVPPQNVHQYIFCILAQNRKLSDKEFLLIQSLKPGEREYYLGLLVLTQPDHFTDLVKSYKLNSLKDKSFYLLSRQIKQGKSEPELSSEEMVFLSEVLPEKIKYKDIKSMTYIEKIVLPTPAFAPKKFENYLKDAIYRVRRSRKMVAEDLKKTNYQRQVLTLEKAVGVEKGLAEAILSSPIPEDLDPAQRPEYSANLAELASEFSSQADEYGKIRSELESKLTEKISKTTELMNLDLWPWPNNNKIEIVKKAISDQSFLLGFLLLDQLRDSKEISLEEYYLAKSRMILLSISNEFAIEYLHAELSQAQQGKLLEKWNLDAKESKTGAK